MNIKQAPIKETVITETGENNPLWNDWFNNVTRVLGAKRNQQSIAWTPTVSGISYSGTGTVSGTYTQKDNLVFVNVIIDAGAGTSTATLNISKITNLPRKSDGYWTGRAFMESSKSDLGAVLIVDAGSELYLPAWSCTGRAIVSANYITSE